MKQVSLILLILLLSLTSSTSNANSAFGKCVTYYNQTEVNAANDKRLSSYYKAMDHKGIIQKCLIAGGREEYFAIKKQLKQNGICIYEHEHLSRLKNYMPFLTYSMKPSKGTCPSFQNKDYITINTPNTKMFKYLLKAYRSRQKKDKNLRPDKLNAIWIGVTSPKGRDVYVEFYETAIESSVSFYVKTLKP